MPINKQEMYRNRTKNTKNTSEKFLKKGRQ